MILFLVGSESMGYRPRFRSSQAGNLEHCAPDRAGGDQMLLIPLLIAESKALSFFRNTSGIKRVCTLSCLCSTGSETEP